MRKRCYLINWCDFVCLEEIKPCHPISCCPVEHYFLSTFWAYQFIIIIICRFGILTVSLESTDYSFLSIATNPSLLLLLELSSNSRYSINAYCSRKEHKIVASVTLVLLFWTVYKPSINNSVLPKSCVAHHTKLETINLLFCSLSIISSLKVVNEQLMNSLLEHRFSCSI